MFTGPNIVTEGLVLALDAGNKKSYPGSGTTWYDLSGNGNNGTLNNTPSFNNQSGGSIDFDGTNDYIRIISNDWAKSGDDITVLCNLKREGISEDGTNYSSILNYSGDGSGLAIFSFYVTADGVLGGWVYGSTSNYSYSSNYTINLNTWYQVGFRVQNGSTFTVSTFVNGVNISNHTSSDGIRFANSNNTNVNTIGAYVDRNQYEWNGKISNMLIYNRALTATEIQQNYNATKSRFGLT